MAAGGVDVSRTSVASKKDYDFYRNVGSRDGERRQIKRPNDHRSRLAYEKRQVREEVEVQRPLEKRRKFSPILWDAADKGVKAKTKTPDKVTKAPSREKTKTPDEVPKAPLSREKTKSPFTIPYENHIPFQDVDVALMDQVNVIMSPVEARLFGENDDMEEGQLEEEHEVIEAPIKKSRWGSSPGEEVLTSNHDNAAKSGRWNRSSMSPECGELVVSEEQDYKSSGSGSGNHSLEKLSSGESSERECNSSDHDEEPASPAQGVMNMMLGSRSVNAFQKLNKINEGTYGIVYKARDMKTNEIVALKKIKMKEDRYEEEYGFPLTSLREINILLSCNHPSIVNVKEVVVGGKNESDVYMVMEHLEHDLKGLMERMKQPYSTSEVKCLMLQLLEGLHYLHTNWIIHRDLKPSNLLMNNTGELKICDFGMARQYGSPIKPYTQMVITQWYRPPELLLGAKEYSTAVDMWSVGCIMAELLSGKALFQGTSELDQMQKIFAVLGTPNDSVWPGFSSLPNAKAKFPAQPYNQLRKKFPAISFTGGQILSERGFDLLNSLLSLDPERRLTAEEALDHGWFHEVPLPKSKDFMPTFPPKS